MTAWLHAFLDTPAAEFAEASHFWASITRTTRSPLRGESEQFLTLVPDEGASWVKMQAVPGAGGMHLDLDSHDREAAVALAQEWGAMHAWTYRGVVVMRSPGGLTFCHTLAESRPDDPPRLARDSHTVLDQICLDIPRESWEHECAFWSAMTGRAIEPGNSASYARLLAPDAPRILLQRLDEADGAVRAHLDLATNDRASESARHVGLGASVLAEHSGWSVLRAPGRAGHPSSGQVYCLTDRSPQTGAPFPWPLRTPAPLRP